MSSYEDPAEGMLVVRSEQASAASGGRLTPEEARGVLEHMLRPVAAPTGRADTIRSMNWMLLALFFASAAITFFAIWGLVDFLTWLL